jgi:hypothetical protein
MIATRKETRYMCMLGGKFIKTIVYSSKLGFTVENTSDPRKVEFGFYDREFAKNVLSVMGLSKIKGLILVRVDIWV